MHQFAIAPLGGNELAASPFQFTNSALWMLIVLAAIVLFMWGGTRRQLVPGPLAGRGRGRHRLRRRHHPQNIGPEGRAYLPWIFTAFMFILFSNWIGAMPLAIVGPHPVHRDQPVHRHRGTLDHQLRDRARRWASGSTGCTSSRCSCRTAPRSSSRSDRTDRVRLVPGAAVQPRAAAVRGDVRGHILLEVFGNFVVQGLNAGIDGSPMGWAIAVLCFVFVIGVNALELLVGAIQAFVFALLTSLYIKDAVHLH
jgi:F-type H+-transporting ATPase subunit a